MKIFLIIVLMLVGVVGLALSLCGGVGAVMFPHDGGIPVGGTMLVIGVLLIFGTVKGIGALTRVPPAEEQPQPGSPPATPSE